MANIRENEQKLKACFQKIADALVPYLPNGWQQLVIGQFYAEDASEADQCFQLRCAGDDDYFDLLKYSWDQENQELEDGLIDVTDVIEELHSHCKENLDNWTEMTLKIAVNGSFHVDFSYDPIPEFDGRFLLNWKSRALEEDE